VTIPDVPPSEIDWRGLRLALGLTQAGLATLLQVRPFTVYCWEHGRQRPAPVTLALLRIVLQRPHHQRRLQEAGYQLPPALRPDAD